MIWVNDHHREYKVFVQDTGSRRTWLLSSRSCVSLASPRIIVGQDNNVWAFWSETQGPNGAIFYRVFNQREWSPAQAVPHGNDFPALNPDAAADDQGNIWVAWSGYDGYDYEIYLSCWNGRAWLKEIRITDNRENDVFPSIALGPEDKPLLTWTQSSPLGGRVLFKSLEGGGSGQEIKITPAASGTAVPRIFIEGKKIGIIWKSADGVKIKEFSSQIPQEVKATSSMSQPLGPLLNPDLDENRYVGFGDSITYGYIDRLPAPELGYIPRLDEILNQNFGPSQIFNEGIPGETTIGGLSRIDSVITANAARYFLIMEGTNDVITNDLSVETSAFNLHEMIRKCLEAGAFPAIATIIPRRDWLWDYDIVREKHLSLVEKIRQVAADFPVPLVDLYDLFLNYPDSDGGLLSLLSNDLLHPGEKGYEFMAESWFGEIHNLPFPPIGIQVSGRNPAENALSPQKKGRSGRPPKKNFLSSSVPAGKLLAWQNNPKIYDPARIKGYKVYRKKRGAPGGIFRLRAFVPGALSFFDSGANTLDEFIYLISTVRDDGIEGPSSGPID
jgi:lysophospholipase L1-like esterase